MSSISLLNVSIIYYMESKFKQNLIYLRKTKNLSQQQLAKNLGYSRTAISSWENGAREPSIITLMNIAKYFDVTLDFLVGLEDYDI